MSASNVLLVLAAVVFVPLLVSLSGNVIRAGNLGGVRIPGAAGAVGHG